MEGGVGGFKRGMGEGVEGGREGGREGCRGELRDGESRRGD